MFCNQCEQTSKGIGCTTVGVCGKTADVSALQDLLIHQVKGTLQSQSVRLPSTTSSNFVAKWGGARSPRSMRASLEPWVGAIGEPNECQVIFYPAPALPVAPEPGSHRLGQHETAARSPEELMSTAGRSLAGFAFGLTDWSEVEATEHRGERGSATWRTRQFGGLRVRLVDYSHGYLAESWCVRGPILLGLEGEPETELADGRKFTLRPGMSYQVADGAEPHRSSTAIGARLFIVD